MGMKTIRSSKQPPLPGTGKGADHKRVHASTKPKRRGAGKSANRANVWRFANARHNALRRLNNKLSRSSLSYSEVITFINNRQRQHEEPSGNEVEEMVKMEEAQVEDDEEREAKKEYQRSVAKDDSLIYGNLSMDHKDDNVFRFLSININGLPFSNYSSSCLSATMWNA